MGKHRILFERLKTAGCTVRYRVCTFRWDALGLPKEIVAQAPKEIDYHLFVEVNLDGKWICLDCSNDSALGRYYTWDGESNTKLLVPALQILTPQESIRQEKATRTNFEKTITAYHDFFVALNTFLDDVRMRLRVKS